MNDQVTPQSMEEFRKIGRQTLYKAIAGGLIAGIIAAGGILLGYISQLSGKIGLVPDGAVMAFDLDTRCPNGWKDVSEIDRKRYAGRVIIAAGPRVDRGGNGTTLERKFGEIGGEEKHNLTVSEMPSHGHENPVIGSTPPSKEILYALLAGNKGEYGGAHGRPTQVTGGSQPHNNMPPYIALYYCKKG